MKVDKVFETAQFSKAVKKLQKQKRGKTLEKLSHIINELIVGEVTTQYHNHLLNGEKRIYDLHVEPDLILLYRYLDDNKMLLSLELNNLTNHKKLGNKLDSFSPTDQGEPAETYKLGEDLFAYTEELSQEEQSQSGLTVLLNDLINDENEAINGYESAKVMFAEENKDEFIPVIESIIEDERNHIGNLQELLDRLKPGVQAELDKGQEEAIKILDNEDTEEVVIDVE